MSFCSLVGGVALAASSVISALVVDMVLMGGVELGLTYFLSLIFSFLSIFYFLVSSSLPSFPFRLKTDTVAVIVHLS